MLQLDLNASDQKLIESITDYCSAFGRVVSVKIFRSPVAFTMVEMGNQVQTMELAGHFGVSMFGRAVVIHMEQSDGVDEDSVG